MSEQGNILFCGVGGQGILLASEVTAYSLLAVGMEARKSEVHGMAQRGGGVQSHLRFSEQPIDSSYLVRKAGFVGVHQFSFFGQREVLNEAEQGATVVAYSALRRATEMVRTPVGHTAAGIVGVGTPAIAFGRVAARATLGVVRSPGSGAQPKIPVDVVGNVRHESRFFRLCCIEILTRSRDQAAATRKRSQTEIMAILTPRQARKYEKMISRREKRRQRPRSSPEGC